MSDVNTLLFGIYPYIAFAVCVVGCWIRFDREPYTWKAQSSQMLSNKGRSFWVASNLFHIGILFILMGHFVGLLTPASVYHHVISTENKQLVAMVTGGFFGLLCLIGLLMLIYRRLMNPAIRVNSSKSDVFVLFLLLLQLLLGLATIVASTQHLDGSVMVLLGNWAQSIVTLHGFQAAQNIAQVSIIYKLHVFFGLTIILVFPFTRLVHMLSAPIWYFGRKYQVVRQRASY